MIAPWSADKQANRPGGPNEPPAAEASARSQRSPMSGSAPGGLEEGVATAPRIIAPSLLLPAEIIVFELKPSLWYVAFVCLPVAAAGLAVIFLSFAIEELTPTWRHWGMLIGTWIIAVRLAVGLLQWLGRTYVLTDRRILMQYGVFDVHVECMGLEEITNTFVAQAASQRAVGIGTLFFRCGPGRRETLAWEHIARPKEVHGRVILQIDRWKRSLEMMKHA